VHAKSTIAFVHFYFVYLVELFMTLIQHLTTVLISRCFYFFSLFLISFVHGDFKLIGIEGVKLDRGANRVTVVGTMDPWKLQDRMQKKTKKKVEVISPAKKNQGSGGGCEKQITSDSKSGDKQEKHCVNSNKKEKHCDNTKNSNKGDKEDQKKGDNKQENSCNPKEEGKKCDKQV
jgi:hypothetical protein